MKIRTGFVSNSSTSSFLVAYTGDDVGARASFYDAMKVPQDSPLFELVEALAGLFIDESDIVDEDDDIDEDFEDLRKQGFTVKQGIIATDGDDWAEKIACEMPLMISTENFKLKHDTSF